MANIGILRAALETRFDIPTGIRPRPAEELFATGVAAIDGLAGGGIARGTLTEICGTEIRGAVSTGKTSLVLAALARATDRDECCAWIDASGAFDPESAELAGVRLNRLLWVNCRGDAEKALKAADMVIQAGGFGLVIFDLAGLQDSMARRISLTSWFRLRHAAEQNHTALVAIGQRAIGQSSLAGSCAALQIMLGGVKALWRGILLHGLSAMAENRRHTRVRSAQFDAVR